MSRTARIADEDLDTAYGGVVTPDPVAWGDPAPLCAEDISTAAARSFGGPWSVRIDGTERYGYGDHESAHEYAQEASRAPVPRRGGGWSAAMPARRGGVRKWQGGGVMEIDDDDDDAPRLVEQAYRCRWYDDRLCWWQGGWETVRAMWPAQAAARYMARHPRGIVDLHGVAVMDEQGTRVVVKLVEEVG